jgi:hypothetical protein
MHLAAGVRVLLVGSTISTMHCRKVHHVHGDTQCDSWLGEIQFLFSPFQDCELVLIVGHKLEEHIQFQFGFVPSTFLLLRSGQDTDLLT